MRQRTFSGRSFALSSRVTFTNNVILNLVATPDTGLVITKNEGLFGPPCRVNLELPLAVKLCSSVRVSGGTTLANASVASVNINLPGLPVIVIGAVDATSSTSCAGSTGTTNIAYLSVGGKTIIATPTLIKPNTAVVVGNISLVLNQQMPLAGAGHGLTVNAIHLSLTGGLASLLQADLVVSSATSEIEGC